MGGQTRPLGWSSWWPARSQGMVSSGHEAPRLVHSQETGSRASFCPAPSQGQRTNGVQCSWPPAKPTAAGADFASQPAAPQCPQLPRRGTAAFPEAFGLPDRGLPNWASLRAPSPAGTAASALDSSHSPCPAGPGAWGPGVPRRGSSGMCPAGGATVPHSAWSWAPPHRPGSPAAEGEGERGPRYGARGGGRAALQCGRRRGWALLGTAGQQQGWPLPRGRCPPQSQPPHGPARPAPPRSSPTRPGPVPGAGPSAAFPAQPAPPLLSR